MCCDNNEKVLNRLLKGTADIVCWKVVTEGNYGPYERQYKYKVGINKANEVRWTQRKLAQDRSAHCTYNGIHCKRTRQQAFDLCKYIQIYSGKGPHKVIRVVGKRKHLVGANGTDLVFTQVQVASLDAIVEKGVQL